MTTPTPSAASDHIDQLRKEHPHISPAFFDMMAKRDEAERTINATRERLAHLIGYHGRAGAVPIAELRQVLDILAGER